MKEVQEKIDELDIQIKNLTKERNNLNTQLNNMAEKVEIPINQFQTSEKIIVNVSPYMIDLGNCKHGTKRTFEVRYTGDLKISKVKGSCGCMTPDPSQWKDGIIKVSMDMNDPINDTTKKLEAEGKWFKNKSLKIHFEGNKVFNFNIRANITI